jgi:hypothetical protein
MAKKKRKPKSAAAKSTGSTSSPVPASLSLGKLAIYGAIIALVGWMVAGYFENDRAGTEFSELLKAAEDNPSAQIQTFPSEGRTHVPEGSRISYRTDPPTSGSHLLIWINPGFYEDIQPSNRLVHSLEHGMVVIYYDKPTSETMGDLENWSSLFRGPWSGIVVAPRPGLGEEVIVTAWRNILRLEKWDRIIAAKFIDRFRGRGPENAVR